MKLPWVLAVSSFLLSGCSTDPAGTSSPAITYRFGAIFSQTGRYAFVGKPGAEVVSKLNGKPVEFVMHDSGGDRSRALQSYRELSRDPRVLGVVGPATTEETLALIEVADEIKLPCLSISASDRTQPGSPWVFRLPITTYHMVYQLCDYLARRNLRNIALISVETAFGKAGRREFLTQAPEFGLSLKRDVISPDRKLSPQEADQLVARAMAGQPQALVVWWSAAGAVELTAAARRQRISVPLLHSGGIAGPEFLQQTGADSEGVLFPGSPLLVPDTLPSEHQQKPPIDQFTRFCGQHGLVVSNFAGYGWDAAQLLLEAAQQAGPDRAKIRAYLENQRDRAAVSGVYSFTPSDHNGLTHDSFLMIEIHHGQWRPAPEAAQE